MYDAYDEHDDYGESADDMLESTRSNPLNSKVGDNPLPEDNDRPAAPADRNADTKNVEVNQQFSDTNEQAEEIYERGPHGSAYVEDNSQAKIRDDSVTINRWEDV